MCAKKINTTSIQSFDELCEFVNSTGIINDSVALPIEYPVTQDELDRLTMLSNGMLYNDMGELFISKKSN